MRLCRVLSLLGDGLIYSVGLFFGCTTLVALLFAYRPLSDVYRSASLRPEGCVFFWYVLPIASVAHAVGIVLGKTLLRSKPAAE